MLKWLIYSTGQNKYKGSIIRVNDRQHFLSAFLGFDNPCVCICLSREDGRLESGFERQTVLAGRLFRQRGENEICLKMAL